MAPARRMTRSNREVYPNYFYARLRLGTKEDKAISHKKVHLQASIKNKCLEFFLLNNDLLSTPKKHLFRLPIDADFKFFSILNRVLIIMVNE